jgi:HK97 family phage major capsid protein
MAFTADELKMIQNLNSNVQAVTKRLETLETTPARGQQTAKGLFHGFNQNPGPWEVDKHKFAHLGGAYASAAAEQLSAGRQKKLSGMGPCFIKMAALAGDKDALAYASRMPDFSSDYNADKLEAQYGCTTIVKAKEQGVPGWDRSTRKVLLNERRKTSLAENSGMAGGYTVPPQFLTELMTIAGEDSFVEPRCKQIPMNSRTFDLPMLDIMTAQAAGTTPYGGGILFQWQPESVSYNQTQPQFRQSTWTAWDLVGVTVSSNQLLADNGIGLDALLTQLFGWGITFYKQYAFLQGLGAGSSMPLGVLNAPATIMQTRVTPGRFKLADAAAMISHAQIRSWDTACWVMHQSVIPELIQMVDNGSSNRLVWVNPMGNPGASNEGPAAMKLPMAFLNGLPIYFTECVPTLGTAGDVMLIDWSRYVVGNRMDMQIDVSPHVLFQSNQLMWRVITRCDGKPWLQSPITDAQGWEISPFVALN